MRVRRFAPVLAAWLAAAAQDRALPPAGYGTLRQDEVAVRLRTPALELRVLPLDEGVIRLLAPDAYQSLATLVISRLEEIGAAARRLRVSSPTVMMVTAFGVQPDVRFDPQQLQITSRGQIFRPLEILPLTPEWDEQRLPQRAQPSAIYLFAPGLPIFEDSFEVSYEGTISRQWQRSRRLLEAERAQVYARAAQDSSSRRR